MAGDAAAPDVATSSTRVETLQRIVAQYYSGHSEAAIEAALAEAERGAVQHGGDPTHADLPQALRGYLGRRRAERATAATEQASAVPQPEPQLQAVDASPATADNAEAQDQDATLFAVPASAMGNENKPPAETSALDELSPADQVRARRVVADHAGRYGWRLGREAAVRYVVEGHLEAGLRGAYAPRVLREVAEELIPVDAVFDPRDDRTRTRRRQRSIEESIEPHVYRLNLQAWTPATVQPLIDALTDAEQVDPDVEIVLPNDAAMPVETLRERMQTWLDEHTPVEQDATPPEAPDSPGITATADPQTADDPALEEPNETTPTLTTTEDSTAATVVDASSTPHVDPPRPDRDEVDVADETEPDSAEIRGDSPGIIPANAAANIEPEQGDQAATAEATVEPTPGVESETATADKAPEIEPTPPDPELSMSAPTPSMPQEDSAPAEASEATVEAFPDEAPEPRRWRATIDLRNLQSAAENQDPGTSEAGGAERVDSPESVGPTELAEGGIDAGVVPGGPRVRANMAALQLSVRLQDEGRQATVEERAVLDGWRSWGAVPQVFDTDREAYAPLRERLQELLGVEGYAAARRTTINAHYTDPAVVGPMWDLLTKLGYDPGRHRVLEPGCGAGGFFDAAPEGAEPLLTGVELDPATARIASQRHPEATIRTESFADSPLPDRYADVVIGNVPFAEVSLHDPRHNPGRRLTMHNHFIVKSLNMTAPGGIVAVLTSRYTLDSRSPSARQAMYELGDLLGAVRLPNGAHGQWAGTNIITDLVVFRRRHAYEAPGDSTWLTATPSPNLDQLPLNDYFREHPEKVIGTLGTGQGQHGHTTMKVTFDRDTELGEAFAQQLDDLERRTRDELHIEPGQPVISTDLDRALVPPPQRVARASDPTLSVGFMSVEDDGTIVRRTYNGELEPVDVPKSAQREVRELLGMRDTVLELLQTQAAEAEDTPAMQMQRDALAAKYRAYVDRYGPINRYSVSYRANRKDPDSDPIESRRMPTAIRAIATDPFAGTVKALEVFDDATQTAQRATVFTRRVVAPRSPRTSADSPADALAITMDTHGHIDLDHVAELLDVEATEARERLGALVYNDPADEDRLVPAAEYLSGNVRHKLKDARAAAALNPAYRVNVEGLEGVVPRDLGPEDIAVRLGAVWVPAEDVQTFMREILDDRTAQVHHDGGSNWDFTGNKASVAATQDWGTARRSVFELATALSTQQRIVVMDTIKHPDGERRVLNLDETAAAQEKAVALNERFGAWIWEDPERASRLADHYNDTFNGLVLRDYDTTAMAFPGLAANFIPRPHQRAAVARMLYEPSVGLYHEVGAGKTAEMVMGCMELRRLGMVNKPAVVVPNHMLEQFSREWLQLYPQAQILAASSNDLTGAKRRDFVARAALGDWDAVILTQGAFKRIPVSPEAEAAYTQEAAAAARERLAAAKRRGDERTIKQAEKSVLQATEDAKEALEVDRDPGITWEQTGIDYLCVDELHTYKNLTIFSSDRSLAKDGSQRATDLDLKIGLLRARAGTRGRVITGATATPIANSISEMYVMQHYLRPDLLREAGITDFDSWAVTFGQSVTDLEIDPAGGKYRINTRFARFQNVPELLRIWGVAADVKTAEDLALPTPDLAMRPDGQRLPEVVAIDPSPATEGYLRQIVRRAEVVRDKGIDPEIDNMLAITNDGRAAALDLHLVSPRFPAPYYDPPGTVTKLTAAADRIAAIWQEHRDDVFLDAAGEESPNRGGLQIVFADLGTPKDDNRFSAYTELRKNLVERGMDLSRIRFIHEARNDAEKGRMFAACRSGQVDVIIGSTGTMGVGTNIQARAVALHHLDCPWKPADIRQREGRILRQGNQNDEVRILRYVTLRTFDAYSWQTVERKAGFINQVMKGRLDIREIEDIGSDALSFAEVKALASDDPNTLRRAQAQAEVARLERAERAHDNAQATARYTVSSLESRIEDHDKRLRELQSVVGQVRDTRGDRFGATVEGQHTTKRAEAGEALARILIDAPKTTPPHSQRIQPDVVTLGGLSFELNIWRISPTDLPKVSFRVADAPDLKVEVDFREQISGAGLVTRLENCIANVPRAIVAMENDIATAEKELDRARNNVGKLFKDAAALEEARQALRDVEAEINASITNSDDEAIVGDADRLAASQAVLAYLPGGELDGDAILYHGEIYAPIGPDDSVPTRTRLGFWGYADQDGPVSGPHRWDADPGEIAQWIKGVDAASNTENSDEPEITQDDYRHEITRSATNSLDYAGSPRL